MDISTQETHRLAYTIREVAERIHMSKRSVQRAIKRGDLAVLHIGRCVRIHRDALVKFLTDAESSK
jgi:excisionase family DNA binding protein